MTRKKTNHYNSIHSPPKRITVNEAAFRQLVDDVRAYCASDILLMPSRFDTFACVVLEALSCGLPVIAYPVKGPKDIVIDGVCGLHAADPIQMAGAAIQVLTDKSLERRLRHGALVRARDYPAEAIVNDLLESAGLPNSVDNRLFAPVSSTVTGYSNIA
jgi:glycosyltransferase involved in cell wall biosynthesis